MTYPIRIQTIATSSTPNTTIFGSTTTSVSLISSVTAYISIGSNPVASTSGAPSGATFTATYCVSYATISAGGSGYVVGDVLTLSSTGSATVTVDSVNSSGAIATVSVTASGSVTSFPSNPVSTSGGTGSGATFILTYSVLSITASGGNNYQNGDQLVFSGMTALGAVPIAFVTTVGAATAVNVAYGGYGITVKASSIAAAITRYSTQLTAGVAQTFFVSPGETVSVVSSSSGTLTITESQNSYPSIRSLDSITQIGALDVYQGSTAVEGNHAILMGYNCGPYFPIAIPDPYGTIAIGANCAFNLNQVGGENTFIGTSAAYYMESGGLNTALGMHSLGQSVTATGVTALGNDALRDNGCPGGYNVAIGQAAQAHGALNSACVAIGSQAMRGCSSSILIAGTLTNGDVISITIATTTASPALITNLPLTVSHTVAGGDTIASIASALATAIAAASIVGPLITLGAITQAFNDGTAVVSLQFGGSQATGWCLSVTAAVTGAQTETATVSDGSQPVACVAIGENSMEGIGLTGPVQCVYIGTDAGRNVVSGNNNVGIGYSSFGSMTTAGFNTALGAYAGGAVTTGGGNVLVGCAAGQALTNGGDNTLIGLNTGSVATTASYTVAVGQNAGETLTSGQANILLGPNVASTTLTTGSYNILIGVNSSCDVASAGTSNTVLIKGEGTAVLSSVNTNGTPTTIFGGFHGTVPATGITAHAGGGQTSATLLAAGYNTVTTVATAADSVKLPVFVSAGMEIKITNTTTNACQIFGSGTDTINGIATATGISLPGGKTGIYTCAASGAWFGGYLT